VRDQPGVFAVADVRVLVAEARAMAADTMARAVARAQGLTIVARCADPAEVARSAGLARPDVAVLDVSLYGHDPYDAVRSLREQAPKARVLLVMPRLDVEDLAQALLAGADNCISAFVDREGFVRAIRATWWGESIVPAEFDGRLPQVIAEMRAEGNHLSHREVEVLRLAATGMSVADLASELFVSRNTAHTHLARAYRKLGVHNRSGAVAVARRSGLLR